MSFEEKNPIDVFASIPLKMAPSELDKKLAALKNTQQQEHKAHALHSAVSAFCPLPDDAEDDQIDRYLKSVTRLADGFLGWLEGPKRDIAKIPDESVPDDFDLHNLVDEAKQELQEDPEFQKDVQQYAEEERRYQCKKCKNPVRLREDWGNYWYHQKVSEYSGTCGYMSQLTLEDVEEYEGCTPLHEQIKNQDSGKSKKGSGFVEDRTTGRCKTCHGAVHFMVDRGWMHTSPVNAVAVLDCDVNAPLAVDQIKGL